MVYAEALYLSHILSVQSAIGFGPFDLSRIPLHFEVLMTFGSTKSKNLQTQFQRIIKP